MNNQTKVLIVDDDTQSRELLCAMLQIGGYQVISATSGPQALGILKINDPDCVLADVQMPEMTVYELCYRIKQDPSLSNTPVILLSGFEDPKYKQRGLMAGADEYLTKPVSYDQLLRSIHGQCKQAQLNARKSALKNSVITTN